MARLITTVVSGLTIGSTYALIALGLVLGFRATRTFNFAHGQFMLLAASFAAHLQNDEGTSSPASVAAAVVLLAAVGVVIYRVVLQRMVGRPLFMQLVVTLGLAACIDGVMGLAFGTEPATVAVPGMPSGVFEVGGARVSRANVVVTVVALALVVATSLTLRRTSLGARVRAAGQNPVLASQGGINVYRIYMGSWAAAAGLAACAGLLYGSTNVVTPEMSTLALSAFPAMFLGGLDSVEGAAIGGVSVGLLQAFVASYWGGENVVLVTYSLLLVVLLCYPHGLLGTKEVARA